MTGLKIGLLGWGIMYLLDRTGILPFPMGEKQETLETKETA